MDSVYLDITVVIASAVCLPGFALSAIAAWGSLNRYRQREELEE